MNYLLIFDQKNHGCDYTIGCGINYEIITANSMNQAIVKAMKMLDDYSSMDDPSKELQIFEISDMIKYDLTQINEQKRIMQEKMDRQREIEELEKRLKELKNSNS